MNYYNETDFDYIKQSSVKLNLKITGQGEVITLGEVSETEYNQWQNQDEEISDDDDEITYDFFWDHGNIIEESGLSVNNTEIKIFLKKAK